MIWWTGVSGQSQSRLRLRSFRSTTTGIADLRTWAGIALPQTVSFGQDGAGEVYLVAQTRVWRVVRKP